MTPDLTVLGKVHRRRAARGGLRRPARPDGADRPRRRRLPGGHAVRQPAGHGGRPRHAAAARRRAPTSASDATDRARWPPACARRPPSRRARPGRAHAPASLTVFFSERPVHDYAGAAACDLEAHAAFCRALLDARRLPAAVAVRGLVPVAGPRRRARRAHGRGGARRVRGGGVAMSVLDEVVGGRRAGAGARTPRPRPGPSASRARGEDRASAVRAGGRLRGLPPALRRRRAPSRGMDDDLRLLAGDALYALGLARLADDGRPGGGARSCPT